MISSSIKVFDFFPDVTAAVDELAVDALNVAAEAAAAAAKAAGAERGATDIDVIHAHVDLDGFSSGIKGKPHYRFQSYGTLGKAIRPKRPGHKRSHAEGTGITPNRMFHKGRSAGRKALQERVARGIR